MVATFAYWLLWVMAFQYWGLAAAYAVTRQWGLAGAFFAYGIANISFTLVPSA